MKSALTTLVAVATLHTFASAQQPPLQPTNVCSLHTTIVHNSALERPEDNQFSMRAEVDSLTYDIRLSDLVIDANRKQLYVLSDKAPFQSLPLPDARITFSADSAHITHTAPLALFGEKVYLRMQKIGSARGFFGRAFNRVDEQELSAHRELWDSLHSRRIGAKYSLPCGQSLELHRLYGDGENDYLTVRFEDSLQPN